MKPTAIRANKPDLSLISSISSISSITSTNNVPAQNKMAVCSTPSKNHSLNASPAIANITQNLSSGAIISTATNNSIANTTAIGMLTAQNTSAVSRDDSHLHGIKTNTARDQPIPINNVILPSAPAFSAVAKHNASLHTANDGRPNQQYSRCGTICNLTFHGKNVLFFSFVHRQQIQPPQAM